MARRSEPAAPCLQVHRAPPATGTDMLVAGEIDVDTAPQLLEACDGACEGAGVAGEDLRIDLSQVTFCDVVGLNALLAARRAAQTRGRRLTYTNLPPHLSRLIRLAGVDGEML